MPNGLVHGIVGLPVGLAAAAAGGLTGDPSAHPLIVVAAIAGAWWPDFDKTGATISTFSGRRTLLTMVTLPISMVIERVFGHRGAFHSLVGLAVFGAVCYFWQGRATTYAFAAGYLSHLLLDHFFTKTRVPWTWPLGRRRDKYGRYIRRKRKATRSK